jgi:hypothetical protein
MCRKTFAAIAAAVALSPLQAQEVPGRDLFQFPLGTLAEAPALASAAGGGFWNPATLTLRGSGRWLASVSALTSPIDQGVNAQLATVAARVGSDFTAGISLAHSSVEDILQTDTDPLSIGDPVPYRSTILSGIFAGSRGPITLGLAVRRRAGAVDNTRGSATSIDLGGTIDRPAGLPFRAAIASFLLSPSGDLERMSTIAAVEGYIPVSWTDLRSGLSYEHLEAAGSESFLYVAGHTPAFDLRGGIARRDAFGSTTTRLRLGLDVRYARYLVGIAREDGTAGFGATYQFMLTTVFP